MSALRIAVGFKVTPDYEALRPADWARAATGPGAHGEATRYVRRVFNVFDEAALELALRLRDARAERGLETSLVAFSIAGREAGPFLATLQALGYEGARVEPAADLDFAPPAATAALVAAATRRLGGELLLLGSRCGPGDTGLVPFLTAEALGLPSLPGVTAVEPAADRLRVTFSAGDQTLRATVTPPCVLAVGNALVSLLRVPTLKDRLAVRDSAITTFTPTDLGVDVPAALSREPSTLVGLETIDRSRAGVLVAGASPEEEARALYEEHLRGRLERM
jgi:electron transfer flavoprotein beta subunit